MLLTYRRAILISSILGLLLGLSVQAALTLRPRTVHLTRNPEWLQDGDVFWRTADGDGDIVWISTFKHPPVLANLSFTTELTGVKGIPRRTHRPLPPWARPAAAAARQVYRERAITVRSGFPFPVVACSYSARTPLPTGPYRLHPLDTNRPPATLTVLWPRLIASVAICIVVVQLLGVLVTAIVRLSRALRGWCVVCAYPVANLPAGRCPECGRVGVRRRSTPEPNWQGRLGSVRGLHDRDATGAGISV